MNFRLLGPVEARHNGTLVDLGDLQQRYVLVVLLLHRNRPISNARVTEIVWGVNRPGSNLTAGYIAKIRKMFRSIEAEDVTVETTPTGYVLRVAPEQVDLDQFHQLREEAARWSGDIVRATELLRKAVKLWRGRFLEDLDIDRVGGSEVARLDEAYLDALGDLAELELAAGNHRWVRDQLRPVVRAEPDQSRLAILLMRALLANGDQIHAMEVYHRTREDFDKHGLPVPAELRVLARLAQYPGRYSILPPQVPRFTGRAEQLTAITTTLRSATNTDEPSVVWINGMAGIGKTALAIQAAHQLRDLFADGRLYLSLNGSTPGLDPVDPTNALVHLLSDLGVPAEQIPPTLASRAALYQAMLADTRTLIVLDNAADPDQVHTLIPQVAGCAAIITSRQASDWVDTISIRLGPLPTREAATLFRALVGTFRLRGHDDLVDQVMDRCGRVPLAIRTAAAQFRRHSSWPLDQLLALFDEPTSRHPLKETVDAALTAYHQLPTTHQRVFLFLRHIPIPDIGVPAAAALADYDPIQARTQLDDLFEASLIEEPKPERYLVADPLKELTPASKRAAAETTTALDRLLDFYFYTTTNAVVTAFPDDHDLPVVTDSSPHTLAFSNTHTALTWLTKERTNLVALMEYVAHQRPNRAWQLPALLSGYLHAEGHHDTWIVTQQLVRDVVPADRRCHIDQSHAPTRLTAVRALLSQQAHQHEASTRQAPSRAS